MTLPPCTKHGVRGTADPRILAALEASSRVAGVHLAERIESMIDFDGQLWTTWRSSQDLAAAARYVDQAWTEVIYNRGTLHLVRSDADYDYQEDCMNEAPSASGQAGEG